MNAIVFGIFWAAMVKLVNQIKLTSEAAKTDSGG